MRLCTAKLARMCAAPGDSVVTRRSGQQQQQETSSGDLMKTAGGRGSLLVCLQPPMCTQVRSTMPSGHKMDATLTCPNSAQWKSWGEQSPSSSSRSHLQEEDKHLLGAIYNDLMFSARVSWSGDQPGHLGPGGCLSLLRDPRFCLRVE
ncbi:hypothetical protein MRX96_009554 [Rhipicephalus microplus]